MFPSSSVRARRRRTEKPYPVAWAAAAVSAEGRARGPLGPENPPVPHLTQPHLTQPHLTQPHLTQPHRAQGRGVRSFVSPASSAVGSARAAPVSQPGLVRWAKKSGSSASTARSSTRPSA